MRAALLSLLLFALVASCSGAGPTGTPCETGRSVACTCAGGASGFQECSPAGVYNACACSSVDAGADAAGDVLGLEVAVDASSEASADAPGPEAPAPMDASPEAGSDASPADASADVTSETPPGFGDDAAVASVMVPGSLEQRLYRVEVWRSLNGAPFAIVPGARCDLSGTFVFITIPGARVRVNAFTTDGIGTGTNAIACPVSGVDASDSMARYESGSSYSPPGTSGMGRRNAFFSGGVSNELCGGNGSVRLEIFAFGCVARVI